ncbi:hypothetical protein [Streptomyces sp. NPDC054804]
MTCGEGRGGAAATDHVVGVLDDGPVPRRTARPAADSLARLDACTLLGAADLARVPGVDADNRDRGFADSRRPSRGTSGSGSRGAETGRRRPDPRQRKLTPWARVSSPE